jgi:hypothetical protein
MSYPGQDVCLGVCSKEDSTLVHNQRIEPEEVYKAFDLSGVPIRKAENLVSERLAHYFVIIAKGLSEAPSRDLVCDSLRRDGVDARVTNNASFHFRALSWDIAQRGAWL